MSKSTNLMCNVNLFNESYYFTSSVLLIFEKGIMIPRSRGAVTKGLVMVPLSHTRLCVCVCVAWVGNESAFKQSRTLFCVRKDAKALLLLAAAFSLTKSWPRSSASNTGRRQEKVFSKPERMWIVAVQRSIHCRSANPIKWSLLIML